MQLPETRFSRAVDGAIRRIGNAIAWIWLGLLGVIVCNVLLRYAFGEGRIEFEELQWHLYSVGMLLGLSYCYSADAHIRVDVLHERFSPRLQATHSAISSTYGSSLPYLGALSNCWRTSSASLKLFRI